MKGLNVRVLATLVGVSVVFVIGIYVVHYFQVRRQAEFYLEKATTFDQSENPKKREEALKYYQQYLGLRQKDTDTRAKLGLLYCDLIEDNPSHLGRAYFCLEQVLRADPLRDDVRRKAVELSMKMSEFDDARVHLDTLQNHDPNDGQLFELRARCQVAQKDYIAAMQSYESAIKLDPKLLDAYVGVATLLRHHGDDIRHGTPVPLDDTADDKTSKDNEAKDEKTKEETPKEAEAKDQKAEEETPKDDIAEKNATDEFEPDYWINKMVERNPETARAYYLRASYLRSMGQFEEAQKDIDSALKLAPEDLDTLVMAIQIAVDQDNYAMGRKLAEKAVKLFDDSPRVYQAFSNLENRAKNRQQAREWIEKGLAATEDAPILIWEKANLLISDGELKEVRSLIERLSESTSVYRNPALINYLEARLALAEKEWAKAKDIFVEIRNDVGRYSSALTYQVDQSLYECYRKLGQQEKARSIRNRYQRRSIARTSKQSDSWKHLAQAGRLNQAIARCKKLLSSDDAPPEGWIDLTKLLITHNERLPKSKRNWAEAEEALKKARQLNPDHLGLSVLQAKILLNQRRLDDAMKVLEEAVKRDPTRWDLWNPLVVMAQHNENWDQAAKLLDEAEKHIGSEPRGNDDPKKDVESPKEASKQLVAKTTIYLARARLAVARDGEKATEELKRLGEKAQEMSDSEKIFYWQMLASYCLNAKDIKLAQEYAQKAAEHDPTNLQIRILLTEIAAQLKDEESAKRAIDEIGKIEQKGPLWHYYTAQRIVTFDKNEDKTPGFNEAIQHLDQARMGRPEWPNVPMLLAKIQEQMGDKSAALDNYRLAVELGSRDPLGLANLANLLYKDDQQEEANRILRMLEEAKVNLPISLVVQQGFDMIRKGDISGGARNIKQVADRLREKSENTTDYRLFVELSRLDRTLAKIALKQKRYDEAKKHFSDAEKAMRRATEISPEARELWIELVVLMANSGQIREVSSVLGEAKEKLPADKVALTLAQCYEVLKRLAEAEQQYEKAYRENQDDKDLARLIARFYLRQDDEEKKEKGMAVLRDIIDGKRISNEKDVPWARRRLAILLSKRGKHRSTREAMKMVEANLKDNPDSTPDKRLIARLLAARPSKAERKKALALFEELVRLPKPLPDDRYELAKLYFTEEEWNKASQQMQPLMTMDKPKKDWLKFYIRAQIRAKEFSGAEAKLNRYASMVDDPFEIVAMRARIMSGRGRHVRAIGIIQDYVDNASSAMISRPTRVGRAAQSLNGIAKHVTGPGRDAAIEQYLKLAEQYYREYVQKVPSKTQILVSFLGQNGRREEAMQIAEEAWKTNPSTGIAVSAVALLSHGNPTPDEIQRVEKMVKHAIPINKKKTQELSAQVDQLSDRDKSRKAIMLRRDLLSRKSEETALLLTLAELLSIQKRYDEAEKQYRDVLANDPDNVFALNNLAMFLSLRGLKLDESLRMINKAIDLGGPSAVLLDSRATINIAKGDWKKALDDMSMALSEEPTAIRFFHQAQAYALGGNKSKAIESLRSAEDYGLKVDQLQPLERPAYRKLKEELQ